MEASDLYKLFKRWRTGKMQNNSGLFGIPSDKFNHQHNETILSLQYWKLTREQNENEEECIGNLSIKADKCGYKEEDGCYWHGWVIWKLMKI